MIEEENFEDENIDAAESLIEFLKESTAQRMTMLNAPRYSQAVRSIAQIVRFVKEDCPDAKVEIAFDDLTGTSLCLTIIADELNIYKIKDFCVAIECADTMCVIPRLDSTIEIGFTYEGAQIPVKPAD